MTRRQGPAEQLRRIYKRFTKSSTFGRFLCWVFLGGHRVHRPNVDSENPHSILVIRLDEIGDIVLSSGFLREIRHTFQSSRIVLVVKPEIVNLVELCPYVDELIAFPFPESRPTLARYREAIRFARKNFLGREFDIAILPRFEHDARFASFLIYCSNARIRLGYSEHASSSKEKENRSFDKYFTKTVLDNPQRHEVEHNLHLVEVLGGEVKNKGLEIWLSPEDRQFAKATFRNCGVDGSETIVACCPGASHGTKMWPIDRYASLCAWMIDQYHVRILLVGGGQERELASFFENGRPEAYLNMIGETTIRQCAALMERCSLYFGNDTGLAHIASALNLPAVEIFCHPLGGSPTHFYSPNRYGPWNTASSTLQPRIAKNPCVEYCSVEAPHCIEGVQIEDVRTALRQRIALLPSMQPTINPSNRDAQ